MFIAALFTVARSWKQPKCPSTDEWIKKMWYMGFPGCKVVKNLPANTGDTGSSPGPGRSHMPRSNYAHVPQLLSLHSGARVPQLLKPARLEPVLHSKRSHCNEKPSRCN